MGLQRGDGCPKESSEVVVEKGEDLETGVFRDREGSWGGPREEIEAKNFELVVYLCEVSGGSLMTQAKVEEDDANDGLRKVEEVVERNLKVMWLVIWRLNG